MIGVALVSAAAVFAASLRDTFTQILDRAVTADYVVTDASFQGMPPTVAETLRELPELAAVSPIRVTRPRSRASQRGLGAADPTTLGELLDVDIVSGGYEGMAEGGILVHATPPTTSTSTSDRPSRSLFQSGVEDDLEVAGIFDDNTVAGNWLVSLDTFERYRPTSRRATSSWWHAWPTASTRPWATRRCAPRSPTSRSSRCRPTPSSASSRKDRSTSC
jgi:putative ABC transport system permease protein